jgi:hypothetical protein
MIKKYLDDKGNINIWPAKQQSKLLILEYLSTFFEKDKIYSEKEVNNIIINKHNFNDYFLLRRELIDRKFLLREKDGSKYWKRQA